MPISRTSILRGPAVVQFNGATFHTAGDIEVDLSLETFDIPTSVHGIVDRRVRERLVRVRFTPAGEWESLSILWPYATKNLGDSIFGAVDVPLVIQTRDGKTITFRAAAITSMPDIRLSATNTLIGQVELTCLGTDNMAWTVDESLVAVGANAWADVSFSSANVKTQPYSAAWGASAPWDDFASMEGFTVSFDLSVQPVMVDSEGTIDMTFGDLTVRCACRPIGITEANLIAAAGLQGTGNFRGRSLNTGAQDLVISGTGVTVTLKGAALRSSGMVFGSTSPRIGGVEFVATRTYSAGVAQPLFTLA